VCERMTSCCMAPCPRSLQDPSLYRCGLPYFHVTAPGPASPGEASSCATTGVVPVKTGSHSDMWHRACTTGSCASATYSLHMRAYAQEQVRHINSSSWQLRLVNSAIHITYCGPCHAALIMFQSLQMLLWLLATFLLLVSHRVRDIVRVRPDQRW
jgi:hypothetical protein